MRWQKKKISEIVSLSSDAVLMFKSPPYEVAFFLRQNSHPSHWQLPRLVVKFVVQSSFFTAHLERLPSDYLLSHLFKLFIYLFVWTFGCNMWDLIS